MPLTLFAQLVQFSIWQWLTEPLALEFIRNALIAGSLAGIICPAIAY